MFTVNNYKKLIKMTKAQRYGVTTIAKQLGVTKQNVYTMRANLKKHGVDLPQMVFEQSTTDMWAELRKYDTTL